MLLATHCASKNGFSSLSISRWSLPEGGRCALRVPVAMRRRSLLTCRAAHYPNNHSATRGAKSNSYPKPRPHREAAGRLTAGSARPRLCRPITTVSQQLSPYHLPTNRRTRCPSTPTAHHSRQRRNTRANHVPNLASARHNMLLFMLCHNLIQRVVRDFRTVQPWIT